MTDLRIGIGYDVHAFSDGRDLIIGGVKIDFPSGLAGHSDADVLLHAVIDALLGAAGLGDIGTHFSDRDPQYKNISSIALLTRTGELLRSHNMSIVNIDSVVICEQPKIMPYADQIKRNISAALNGLDAERINIKGKTTEKLGFTGRREGIAAQAVALIETV
jgi:2-C-methyl-D-erythritol 2,4-cyclodiphosphate synthase